MRPAFPHSRPVRSWIANWDIPHPVLATYANLFRLAGYHAPVTAHLGGTLAVDLYWESLSPTDTDYSFFVHLTDPAGHLRAQQDGPLGTRDYPTRWWRPGDAVRSGATIELPTTLPPGRYDLWVGMYPVFEPLRRLPVQASNQPVENNALRLTSVDLVPAR